MAGTGKAKVKAKAGVSEAEEELRHDVEMRQEERLAGERIEQQILNQGGMDTGTHPSTLLGVDWGPSYRLRPEFEHASPTEEQIEVRAYELYVERGREDGHDLDDWLAAERELQQR
jgi:hypothetical protein